MVDALVNISTILNWCKSGYSTGSVNYVSEGSVSISTCITQQYSNLKNHMTKKLCDSHIRYPGYICAATCFFARLFTQLRQQFAQLIVTEQQE